ncbi:MAG TPA: hypothetical protein VEG33_15655 [Streptosporangiaceae bacterium]|nr:hypothetical protein [Streptosporangiaceae bacterium]
MRSHFRYSRPRSQRLADLQQETAELERRLADARLLLEHERLAQAAADRPWPPGKTADRRRCAFEDPGREHDPGRTAVLHAAPYTAYSNGRGHANGTPHRPDERTEGLLSRGRRSARYFRFTRSRLALLGAAVAAVLATVGVTALVNGGASWPPGVATVGQQAETACRNPDVKSEPGQVNFACAASTRQILWVFALLTSGNNPGFVDPKTGRRGLEPITPAQGNLVAWSLNLHHPYNPVNPIDSLQVAARAINNIVGGATSMGTDGRSVAQPGLLSDPANCARYTGSRALTSRTGYPSLCARAVSSPAGQAALVADIYRKWVVGASPKDARDAAVLFANAQNPGDPQVQAILKRLAGTRPLT